MTSNSYPLENGWYSSGINMGMSSQPANFHNIPCAPNFTKSPHPPQNNFTPNQAACPPYDVSRPPNSFNVYHASETVHEKNSSHPYNQGPSTNHSLGANNNIAMEGSSHVKHIPPDSTFLNKQNTFDSGQPYVDTKSNFYPSGVSHEVQTNMPPPPTLSNNGMPLQSPQIFQSFNNNFQHYPSTVPSQPPGNLPPYPPNQIYNIPPPMHGPGMNTMNGSMNTGLPHHNGQFRFGPPSSQQFQMSYGSDMSLGCNQPNQTFNNPNMMLSPPTFRDPPPYPFHLQPTPMQVPPPVMPMDGSQGNVAPSVQNVSLKETKLASFLQKFRVGKEAKQKSDITVVEFRSSLKKGLLLSRMLKSQRLKLLSLVGSSNEEWEVEMKHVVKLQNELSELCDVLSVPSNLSSVQKRLRLIKKKREIKKKFKQEVLSVKLQREKEREVISQEIDKWLDTIKEKNLKQKREIEMKKEADSISSEVRRKIHEAKKTIEKLKLFEKLRAARQANAEQKGLFVSSEQSLHFERKMADLRSLMQSQLCDYEAEEKALRVMLEEEQEEKMEEEAQWRIRKRRMLQQRRQEAIMESLFGVTEAISPEDPLFFFFQYHNSGNSSIENLVQIRHHWDVHLSDAGDPIPRQWVVPAAPSNPSWEEVCKN